VYVYVLASPGIFQVNTMFVMSLSTIDATCGAGNVIF